MKITDTDKKLISQAIKEAELKTSGEIVPVILSKSDFYPAAHFRLALIMGIFFSLICYYTYDFDDPLLLIWWQLPGVLCGYLLAYIPVLKKLFTTNGEIEEEVHQKAIEVFYNNNVSMTRDRTGIMIFISLLEKKVKVLADCGINEKVDKDFWDELVAKLVKDIAKGQKVDGVNFAIKTCGEVLSKSFPIKDDDTNEVSNELIVD